MIAHVSEESRRAPARNVARSGIANTVQVELGA
jgi:hypothetical protein